MAPGVRLMGPAWLPLLLLMAKSNTSVSASRGTSLCHLDSHSTASVQRAFSTSTAATLTTATALTSKYLQVRTVMAHSMPQDLLNSVSPSIWPFKWTQVYIYCISWNKYTVDTWMNIKTILTMKEGAVSSRPSQSSSNCLKLRSGHFNFLYEWNAVTFIPTLSMKGFFLHPFCDSWFLER